MSRVGKMPITIPAGVEVKVENGVVTVSSKTGTLTASVPSCIAINIEGNVINVTRANDEKVSRQLHGTMRANLNNMVVGCSTGFKKELIMKGTGYKAELRGSDVVLYVGYSHPVALPIPEGVKVAVGGQNNTSITVSGIDKQKVGQLAALIREQRLPEPYLGKGVAYVNEHIRRKEGKKAGKK